MSSLNEVTYISQLKRASCTPRFTSALVCFSAASLFVVCMRMLCTSNALLTLHSSFAPLQTLTASWVSSTFLHPLRLCIIQTVVCVAALFL